VLPMWPAYTSGWQMRTKQILWDLMFKSIAV